MRHHNKTTKEIQEINSKKRTDSKLSKLQRDQRKIEENGHFVKLKDNTRTEIFVPEGKDEQQVIKKYKEKRKKL
jgi:hypothetical protein